MISRSRRGRNQISLARAISKFGLMSRAQACRSVEAGEVAVNGKPVVDPAVWLDPVVDRITVKGQPLRKVGSVYFALHKPAGVVTTRSDDRGRRTVYDLLPADAPWVFPIGRLDLESSGLLLLTNDTRFGNRIADPIDKIPKSYLVTLDRQLEKPDLQIMESGMKVGRQNSYLPARVRRLSGDIPLIELTIREGQNRQIRRMCEALGYRVLSLKRIRIGTIELGSLTEGEVRTLTAKEYSSIINSRG